MVRDPSAERPGSGSHCPEKNISVPKNLEFQMIPQLKRFNWSHNLWPRSHTGRMSATTAGYKIATRDQEGRECDELYSIVYTCRTFGPVVVCRNIMPHISVCMKRLKCRFSFEMSNTSI